jgi:hypothetical protein
MNYPREEVRLLILQCLLAAPGYIANQETIKTHLANKGFVVNRDQTKIEIRWLEENTETIAARNSEGVLIVTLTPDGEEVALGQQVVPGIMRPKPTARG